MTTGWICRECCSYMEDGYCVLCDHLPKKPETKEVDWHSTKVKLDGIFPKSVKRRRRRM